MYHVWDGNKWRVSPGEPREITRGRHKGRYEAEIQAVRILPYKDGGVHDAIETLWERLSCESMGHLWGDPEIRYTECDGS